MHFELLTIDDGSTDKSIDVIKEFTDKRIRLISNKHDFINSLNIGLHMAKGKYIARMDADDIMFPHRLQTQLNFMESHPDIGVCGSWVETFGKMNGIIKRPVDHFDIVSDMLRTNPLIHPSVMIRRSMLHQSGCFYKSGYPCAEDYKLWTDLAINGLKFANIPEVLLRYRLSPQQVLHTSSNDMSVSSMKISLEYAEVVMEQMIEKEERHAKLFDLLVEFFNDNLIHGDTLLQMIYPMYREFLFKYYAS
jgi:glycosyltransferase involved in cell wall biosynthesis